MTKTDIKVSQLLSRINAEIVRLLKLDKTDEAKDLTSKCVVFQNLVLKFGFDDIATSSTKDENDLSEMSRVDMRTLVGFEKAVYVNVEQPVFMGKSSKSYSCDTVSYCLEELRRYVLNTKNLHVYACYRLSEDNFVLRSGVGA